MSNNTTQNVPGTTEAMAGTASSSDSNLNDIHDLAALLGEDDLGLDLLLGGNLELASSSEESTNEPQQQQQQQTQQPALYSPVSLLSDLQLPLDAGDASLLKIDSAELDDLLSGLGATSAATDTADTPAVAKTEEGTENGNGDASKVKQQIAPMKAEPPRLDASVRATAVKDEKKRGVKRQAAPSTPIKLVTPSMVNQSMGFPFNPVMRPSQSQSPMSPVMPMFQMPASPTGLPFAAMPGSPFRPPAFNPAMLGALSPNNPHSAAAATFANPILQQQIMRQQMQQQQQQTIDTTVSRFNMRTKWPKCVGRVRLKMFVHSKFKATFASAVESIRAKGNDGSVIFKGFIITRQPQTIYIFFFTGTAIHAVGTVQLDYTESYLYELLKSGLVQSFVELDNLEEVDPASDGEVYYDIFFYLYIPREVFSRDEKLLDMADMDEEGDAPSIDYSGEGFAKYMSPQDRQMRSVKMSHLGKLLDSVERRGKSLHRMSGFIAHLNRAAALASNDDKGKAPKRRKLDHQNEADDNDDDDDDDLSDLSDVDGDDLDEYINFNDSDDDDSDYHGGTNTGSASGSLNILPEDADLDPALAKCLGSITTVVDEENSEDGEHDDDDDALVVDTPKGMATSLRHYQKVALAWMLNKEGAGISQEEEMQRKKLHPLFQRRQFTDGQTFYYNATHGMLSLKVRFGPPAPKGGILADQMGLGKTVEVISLLVANPSEFARSSRIHRTKDGKIKCKATLVVSPLTIVDQWKSEVERHTRPSLSAYVYQGHRRTRQLDKLLEYDVIVTTYNTLSNEYRDSGSKRDEDISPLYQLHFHRVVLDEAHNVKNPNSLQARAVANVSADRRWAVTGTPIQNHVDDLFSLFRFIRVQPHGDQKWWNKFVSKPFDGEETRAQAVSTLDSLIRDIILRRTKSKTIKGKKILDLPKKHVHLVKLKLSKSEELFYRKFHKDSKEEFEGLVKEDSAMKNYASILQLLLYLRQICCHPSLVLSSYMKKRDNAAIRRSLGEFCESQPPEIHDAIFPMMPKVLEAVDSGDIDLREYLRKFWRGSTKINALVKYLNRIKHTDKSVVFSQWTSMLDLVQVALDKNNIRCVRLDGTMSRTQRDDAIQSFKNDPSISTCLVSLKVGGVGLNLVWATHVFLLDPWWNPAVEEQAIDRVHRIGQTREVTVIRFIIKDSVEERILELQKRKNEIVQDTLEESSSGGLTIGVGREGTKIGLDDFKRLFDITSGNSSATEAGDEDDLNDNFSDDELGVFGGLSDDGFFQDMD